MNLIRLFVLIMTSFAATFSNAAPADIDASFGSVGKISFPADPGSPFARSSRHTAILQSDGKLLVVVNIAQSTTGATNPSKVSWQIRRYMPDGLLDGSFGISGSVTVSFDLDFSGGYRGDDYVGGITLLPDGRFVVAGESLGHSSECFFGCEASFLLARFNGDGSLDGSFGSNGKVISNTVLGADSVAIQNNGKILTSGNQVIDRMQIWSMELHRFNVDGSIDQTFAPPMACGGNGTFRLAPDGKIVIVTNILASLGVCITRFNTDGTLDKTFGTQGKTIVGAATNFSFSDFFVDSLGAITVVGGTTTGSLFRLASNGSLDTNFGVAGITETSAVRTVSTGTGDCATRTIVAAPGPGSAFSTARFLPNGSMDFSFAGTTSGFAQTNTVNTSSPVQLLLRPNGRIVALAIDRVLNMLNIVQYQGDTVCGGSAGTTVVEFHNANLDHYFITADPIEAAGIDTGSAGPGWSRTGYTFKSGGSTSVCRFYGSLVPGPNSHFYTLVGPECSGLMQLQASTPSSQKRWNFENLNFVSTPASNNGICPTGTVPVYRAYNNGFTHGIDSGHRISSNPAAIQEVLSRGWINEGVVMCAPQ